MPFRVSPIGDHEQPTQASLTYLPWFFPFNAILNTALYPLWHVGGCVCVCVCVLAPHRSDSCLAEMTGRTPCKRGSRSMQHIHVPCVRAANNFVSRLCVLRPNVRCAYGGQHTRASLLPALVFYPEGPALSLCMASKPVFCFAAVPIHSELLLPPYCGFFAVWMRARYGGVDSLRCPCAEETMATDIGTRKRRHTMWHNVHAAHIVCSHGVAVVLAFSTTVFTFACVYVHAWQIYIPIEPRHVLRRGYAVAAHRRHAFDVGFQVCSE